MCDCTDRRDLLLIERRLPRGAGVGALPDPARDAAEVPGRRISRHPADRNHTASAERADLPPFHTVEERRVDVGSRRDTPARDTGET